MEKPAHAATAHLVFDAVTVGELLRRTSIRFHTAESIDWAVGGCWVLMAAQHKVAFPGWRQQYGLQARFMN